MMKAPPLQQIPADIVTLADYEQLSRNHLSDMAQAWLTGGAADELTLRANRAAFDQLALAPRLLRSMRDGHTRCTLFGQEYDYPVLLAPVAHQKLAHPDGELATVLGASAMGAGMIVSLQASVSLEEIASAAHSPLWLQLQLHPDRQFTRELLQRAAAAGYRALVVTLDAPIQGIRNREQRAGFSLPADIPNPNLNGLQALAPHTARAGTSPLFGSPLVEHAATWDDLAWLCQQTTLPVLAKGILHPEDARLALAQGVSGLIVSNHGGRVLDTVPASLHALPAVVEAAGTAPVFVDGGIRRGTDILKALALGAQAVLIGRPYVHALASAGPSGVAHVLHILRTELEAAMVLSGCRTLAEISPKTLWPNDPPL